MPAKAGKKTKNLKIAEKAAGKVLKQGEAYLLRFVSDASAVRNHQVLVMGTVEPRTMPADGSMDFVATSSELLKEMRIPQNWKQRVIQKCKELHGAKCKHRGIERAYDCRASLKKYKKGEFQFEGLAAPEFGDPKNFIATGEWRAYTRVCLMKARTECPVS